MDTYIENLFKKDSILNSKNYQNIKYEDIDISNNAINNFIKTYSIKFDKNNKIDNFNSVYKNALNTSIDKINQSAKKRNGKYISFGDLKTLSNVQSGGFIDVPYKDFCHNQVGQCSDIYKAGCGQTGGGNSIIPSATFSKLAHNKSSYTIPKNVLTQLQNIVNNNVANTLKK